MFPSNKTIAYPLCLIGIVMIICGCRWLIHPEPWLLDVDANLERLNSNCISALPNRDCYDSFDEVFSESISTLPDYLKQIYRFFGLWVLIIGLFISSLSLSNKAIKHNQIISKIIYIVGLMMLFGMYLGYTLIPSSHFITLMWILLILYIISLYSYIKLKVK